MHSGGYGGERELREGWREVPQVPAGLDVKLFRIQPK
jgi:hypothetical protein